MASIPQQGQSAAQATPATSVGGGWYGSAVPGTNVQVPYQIQNPQAMQTNQQNIMMMQGYNQAWNGGAVPGTNVQVSYQTPQTPPAVQSPTAIQTSQQPAVMPGFNPAAWNGTPPPGMTVQAPGQNTQTPLVQQPSASTPVIPQQTSTATMVMPQQTTSPTMAIPQQATAPTMVMPQQTTSPTMAMPQQTTTPTMMMPQQTTTPTMMMPQQTTSPTMAMPQQTTTPTMMMPQPTTAAAPTAARKNWLVAKDALFKRKLDDLPVLIVGLHKSPGMTPETFMSANPWKIPVMDPSVQKLKYYTFIEGGKKNPQPSAPNANPGAKPAPSSPSTAVSSASVSSTAAPDSGKKKFSLFFSHHDSKPLDVTVTYKEATHEIQLPLASFDGDVDKFRSWLFNKLGVPKHNPDGLIIELKETTGFSAAIQNAGGVWVQVRSLDKLTPKCSLRVGKQGASSCNLQTVKGFCMDNLQNPPPGANLNGKQISTKGMVRLTSVLSASNSQASSIQPTTGIDFISVSKDTMTFLDEEGKIAAIKEWIKEPLVIKNTTKSSIQYVIMFNGGSSRYRLKFEPDRGKIKAHGSVTITAQIAVSCTANIHTDFYIKAKPAGAEKGPVQVCVVHVNMSTRKTTHVDPEEFLIDPEKVGAGVTGSVYRGAWNGQEVAVKVMLDQDPVPDDMESFKREVRALENIRSPYIVRYLGASFVPGSLFVITEFLQYGSVLSAMKKKKFPLMLKIKCLLDTAKGMQFLHNSNIMHRDLKPDNLLMASLDPSDSVCCKITDFGATRCFDAMRVATMTMGVGTPVYMAPEMLLSSHYSFECDVYSFAMIIYFFVAEIEPFSDNEEANSLFVISKMIMDGQRPAIPPGTPAGLEKLMKRCWDGNAASRPKFDAIADFLQRLESALVARQNGNGTPGTPGTTPAAPVATSEGTGRNSWAFPATHSPESGSSSTVVQPGSPPFAPSTSSPLGSPDAVRRTSSGSHLLMQPTPGSPSSMVPSPLTQSSQVTAGNIVTPSPLATNSQVLAGGNSVMPSTSLPANMTAPQGFQPYTGNIVMPSSMAQNPTSNPQ